MTLARLGAPVLAAAMLISCVSASRASAPDACAVGDQALAAAHWTDAYAAYQQCLQTQPAAAVYSNLGLALSRMGRTQDAIESYSKALELEPANAHIEFNLAVTLIKVEQYAPAADHLKHLQRTGTDLRYDELLAFCYFHLASYTLAARAAEHVYAAHPDDAANALILGSTYTRMHLYDRALPLITLALRAAGSAEGHLILAQTLIGLHQYPNALTELQQIAADQPDFPGLHEALGEVYLGTERSHDAEGELQAAIKQTPDDFEALYLLGRLERVNGNFPAATALLNRADQLRPHSPEVAYERAEIAMKERRFADAIPMLELVTKAEPDEAQAVLLLAQAYHNVGRNADAQREGEIYSAKRGQSPTRAEQHPGSPAEKTP